MYLFNSNFILLVAQCFPYKKIDVCYFLPTSLTLTNCDLFSWRGMLEVAAQVHTSTQGCKPNKIALCCQSNLSSNFFLLVSSALSLFTDNLMQ